MGEAAAGDAMEFELLNCELRPSLSLEPWEEGGMRNICVIELALDRSLASLSYELDPYNP